jgi:hypothetical protein
MKLAQGPGGEAVPTGPVIHQAVLGHVPAGEALTVVEFSRKKPELEEVFLSMVEGGRDGR